MKIAVAQTKPVTGNIESNIKNHITFANLAASNGAEIIIFPELSLTGYEPSLAKELATGINDSRFEVFQKLSINQFAATKYTSARVPLQNGKLRLHIFFDKSIVEVFANDGATVITAQVFPTNGHDNIEFFSEKGSMRISTAKVWPLNSAWK